MYDRDMRRARVASIVLAVSLCGSMSASGEEFDVEVQPGKFFEPCMDLTVGQVLHFKFKSAQNLRFNIHYHVGDDVEYPIKVNADRGSGKYTPVIDQKYCLMWTNNSSGPVRLNGNYDVVDSE